MPKIVLFVPNLEQDSQGFLVTVVCLTGCAAHSWKLLLCLDRQHPPCNFCRKIRYCYVSGVKLFKYTKAFNPLELIRFVWYFGMVNTDLYHVCQTESMEIMKNFHKRGQKAVQSWKEVTPTDSKLSLHQEVVLPSTEAVEYLCKQDFCKPQNIQIEIYFQLPIIAWSHALRTGTNKHLYREHFLWISG